MNEKPDRARMHGFAAPAETLEGEQGWTARVDVERTELAGQRADVPSRPAVERVWQAVACLGRALEMWPLQASRESQERDGARTHARQRRAELVGLGVEPAADGNAERPGAPT